MSTLAQAATVKIVLFFTVLLMVGCVTSLSNTDSRSLFTVGRYDSGELGIDLTNTPIHPYPLDNFPFKIKEIYVGNHHTAFLTTSGEIYSLGLDNDGKSGNGSIPGYPKAINPLRFNVSQAITKAAVGYCHTLALGEFGSVFGAGCARSFNGKGGNTAIATPIMVIDSSYNIVDIQAGIEFSALLSRDGKVYVVGQNINGQYGNASLPASNGPVLVNFGALYGKEVIRIRTGPYCTVAETSTKEFILFGTIYSGYQLSKSEPIIIDVISGNNWKNFTTYNIMSTGIVLLAEGKIYEIKINSTKSFVLNINQAIDSTKLLEENRVLTNNNMLFKQSSGSFQMLSLKNIKPGTQIEKMFMGTRNNNGYQLSYYLGNDGSAYFSEDFGYEIFTYGSAGSSFGLYPLNVTTFYNVFNPSLLKMIKPSKYVSSTIFLHEDNTIYSTGDDYFGSLGGNGGSTTTPRKIDNGLLKDKVIVDVSVGSYHTLILTSDGLVYAFGSNMYNQFCNNQPYPYQPLQQLPLSNVTSISAGYDYSLFIINNGNGNRVYACGTSTNGETGLGVSSTAVGYVSLFDEKNIASVFASNGYYKFSFFLTNDGSVFGVGSNQYYVLGVGFTYGTGTISTPVTVSISDKVIKVSAASQIALFLTERGEVYISGASMYYTPTKITVGKIFIDISAGPDFAFLLTNEGEVYGMTFASTSSYYGQIGVGLNPPIATPIKLPLEYKVKSIEAGYSHSFFIMEPSCDLVIQLPTLEENCVIIPPNPSLQLVIPSTQLNALCASSPINLILNASQTTYSPKHQSFILYNWIVQRSVGTVIEDVTTQLFGDWLKLSNFISTNNLLSLGVGDYTFGVNVKDSYNGLNKTTYSSTHINIIASFDLTININGKLANNVNNVLRTSETNIIVNAFNSDCGNINNNLLQYNIKLSDAKSGSLILMSTSNNLIIPPKTFTNVDMYYNVEVEASFRETTVVKKAIQLYVYPQSASLQIIGGNKSASIANSITLNSLLKDLDELSFTPQYSWECKIEDSSNNNCPINLSGLNTPTLTIPSNTFNDAMRVVFTLNCNIGNIKKVTSSVYLQFEKLQLPTISVNSYDNYVSKYKDILFRVNVNPSDKESELLFRWTLINQPIIDLQKISIAGIDKQDIGIKASTKDFDNLLLEGNEYTLQLNVTQKNNRLNQQVFAFTTINFKVNQAPIIGQLTINPLEGIATQTEFSFNVSSFIDMDQPNTPLLYSYGYFKYDSVLKQKEKIILIDNTQNTLIKVKLPFINSTTEVFVIAKDSLGAESLLSTTITLTDPTSKLTNNQITKLVENQLNTTKSVNDILLISSLLNTNNNEQQTDDVCGTNNNCNGNGKCNFNEKKCECYSLYSGKYCQLTNSEKIGRENVRDQLLTSVISVEDNSTSTKTKLQTVESIISNTDEINANVAKKALTYTSTVFSNSKDIQLIDQVIKVISNVIETITTTSTNNNSITKEELNEDIRNTLFTVASQQVNNMIQGQFKSIILSNIKQTIVKETLNTIINSNNNQQVKLTSKLMNILNPNDVIGFETTLIGNQNLFSSEKNVSSSIFRMNIFSNDQQQSIANLTESILFNITINNNQLLENDNLTFICQYYNETTKELSSDGVFVNRIINNGNGDETIIECGTSHLTDFVIVKTSTTKKNIIPVVSNNNGNNNPPREISGKKTVVNQSSFIANSYYLLSLVLAVLLML
ncbi:hypothetical protein ABK040_015799 [Willaertia magna]